MATKHDNAVRTGTQAAARVHQKLRFSRQEFATKGGSIDVFGAINEIGLPLLVRPLEGLLGAYLNEPSHGVLITSRRSMTIQRFTAAHELGHFAMKHQSSIDDESVLRRVSPGGGGSRESSDSPLQEVEANSFAAMFLMPQWLIALHLRRQGWAVADLVRPECVYQLALRLGASYEATCWTLATHRFIPDYRSRELVDTKPRALKVELLKPFEPQDYRRDVWLLTERDAGARIDGSQTDLFVLRLPEHSGGGYLWDLEQLRASGFAIVGDEREALDNDGIGGPVTRRITASAPESSFRGDLTLEERRPWEVDSAHSSLRFEMDLTGPEREGMSRAARRQLFEAA